MAGLRGANSLVNRLDDMAERADSLSREMGPAVLVEITDQMKAAKIPEKSGDLAASLRDIGNPQQVYKETDEGWVFGSTNRAAKYNPDAVPSVDLDAITAVVGEVYTDGD